MIAGRSTSSAASHAEYRRRARRIRRVFAGQPARRVRALRELAQAADANRVDSPANAPDAVVPLPAGAAQTFAQAVRERMDGPVLRYANRTRLIREAASRGINRFEANLIIAAVQHGRRERSCDVEGRAAPSTSPSWLVLVLGFGATQSAIVTGLWWLIR